MKNKIILSEHGDLSVFDTEDRLKGYIEPTDIKSNEYKVFDENGYVIDLSVGVNIKKFLGVTVLKEEIVNVNKTKKLQRDQLDSLIAKYLKISLNSSVAHEDLVELLINTKYNK